MIYDDVSNTVEHHPVGPVAFDALMAELMGIQRRLVRVESKQARLMLHFGMVPQFSKPKEGVEE